MLDNASASTGGVVMYADKKDGYSANSDVVFFLLVNETFGDQLSVTFGDGERHLVNHDALMWANILPDWIDLQLSEQLSYSTNISHVYRRPGTYEVCLLTNDSSGNALELSRTTIVIGYEEIELKDLKLMTCVDDNNTGTILITSKHRLCDVVAEWSYDNQLFIDLVSFSDAQLPVWATVDPDDNTTLYAATLKCRNAVASGRKEFVIGLTGRVFNTTYKFAETHLIHIQRVAVNLTATARRVVNERAVVLGIESVDRLENMHVNVVTADSIFSEYVELNQSTVNSSIVYRTEMTVNMTLPVPENITVTVTGTKDGACFVIPKTTYVVGHPDNGMTDFEVFSHVDYVGNAAVVILAGKRINDIRVSWGSDDLSFVRTMVDLVPDGRPPLWLSTTVHGYYIATLTHQFTGPVPSTSRLAIVEHADDSFAQVKIVRLNRRQPSAGARELSSLSVSRAGASISDCDAQPSDASSLSADTESATERRGPIDRNVYVTTHSDDDGTVTLEFFARHPIRNMIVDWDMPGTASRRMINVVKPASDADGYYTATIRRSFSNSTTPNVTQVRMTGRTEGAAFDVSKELDHARQPPTAGIVVMVPVFPAPAGFDKERQMAFQVKTRSHYVSGNNVTVPVMVVSHDNSLEEVLVIDVACSVRQTNDALSSADHDVDTQSESSDDCSVALDRLNGSLTVSIPGSNLSSGSYNVQIQVSLHLVLHECVSACVD